jgi:hypothetical protein
VAPSPAGRFAGGASGVTDDRRSAICAAVGVERNRGERSTWSAVIDGESETAVDGLDSAVAGAIMSISTDSGVARREAVAKGVVIGLTLGPGVAAMAATLWK